MSLASLEQIYIAVDVEVLDQELSNAGGEPYLPDAFLKLLNELREKSPETVVEVVLVSYRSEILSHVTDKNRGKIISASKPKPKRPRATGKTMGSLSMKGQIGRGLL